MTNKPPEPTEPANFMNEQEKQSMFIFLVVVISILGIILTTFFHHGIHLPSIQNGIGIALHVIGI